MPLHVTVGVTVLIVFSGLAKAGLEQASSAMAANHSGNLAGRTADPPKTRPSENMRAVAVMFRSSPHTSGKG
jgi:hypothetical protein